MVVFVVGIIGGSYGTLVGGTSLITIPLFIFLGLPPHTAIGTDRLGISGLTIAGWYKFHEKGLIDYKIGLATGFAALVGSFLGANLVMEISVAILKKVVAIATLGGVILVAVQPNLGIDRRDHIITKPEYGMGLAATFLVGVYGGFYGAMAGTFSLYVLLFVFKRTFLEGTATLKISAFMMTTTAALVFASKGAIHYPMAAAMFSGCAIGSYFGAHYSDRIGNVWIKRIFIVMVLIMVIKLLIH
ncbi:MAG: sulfite exporter TauE/SafE family protein [Thermodesulfobacteriota bacterium]|nr:sulfite exporter TauE/SafE family protein [Thermodesulfobacteriota bacterium]